MDGGDAAFALLDEVEQFTEAAREACPALAEPLWEATESLREDHGVDAGARCAERALCGGRALPESFRTGPWGLCAFESGDGRAGQRFAHQTCDSVYGAIAARARQFAERSARR